MHYSVQQREDAWETQSGIASLWTEFGSAGSSLLAFLLTHTQRMTHSNWALTLTSTLVQCLEMNSPWIIRAFISFSRLRKSLWTPRWLCIPGQCSALETQISASCLLHWGPFCNPFTPIPPGQRALPPQDPPVTFRLTLHLGYHSPINLILLSQGFTFLASPLLTLFILCIPSSPTSIQTSLCLFFSHL